MPADPLNRIVLEYERAIKRLLRQAGDLSTDQLLNLWTSTDFHNAARQLAEKMVGRVYNFNARSWREAAMRGTRSRTIYEVMQRELAQRGGWLGTAVGRLVAENARLIRSVPADIAREITAFAAEQQQRGLRAPDIAREIRRRAPYLTWNKIRLIARTEVSKAETALTQARSQDLGLDWYEWQTSEDQRVRVSHRNMNHVLVNWNDPPPPEALVGERSTLGRYHAGGCPNCRCVALPMVSLAEIRFPTRVFYNGSLTRMTKAQFSRIAGLPAAA
jgi:SPP1 gp7 family putative phage head morphogenesis protein